ncbi:Centromere/kinetochore protein zw10 involved in mitotic chromosome segregation [Phaffia rhodozyma]|uniref:Centromere/kinetochore protein zw10 involved in mitotic chromosome segregation n=1 Tax=Phaffia rhodozyma TaxID=264483 RepID=A0A0F7SRU1_PHARH|nr:Centromere/kinetochore protein zw10 involved in mitotic chromosome segregation [Phaffia rhodozyma]
MAFEIPSHLRKAVSTSDLDAEASLTPPASVHLDRLLAPLINEPWDSLSAKQVATHLDVVRMDIQSTQKSIHSLVTERYTQVSSLINGSVKVNKSSAILNEKLEKLEYDVDGDETSSLIPHLLETIKTHAHIQHDLSHESHHLRFLQLLSTYKTTFSQLLSTPGPSLPRSVAICLECSKLLRREEWTWTDSRGVRRMESLRQDLEERLRVIKDRVSEQLGRIFEGTFGLDWDAVGGIGVIRVQENDQVSFQELIDSLHTLATLPTLLNTLAHRILNQIFIPLLQTPAFISPSSVSKINSLHRAFSSSYSTDSKLAIFRFMVTNDRAGSIAHSNSWTECSSAQPILQSMIGFLSTAFPSFPYSSKDTSPDTTRNISELLAPLLFPLVERHHLQPCLSLIESPLDLPAFIQICDDFTRWEAETTGGSSTELATFKSDVGIRWAKLKRAKLLEDVRAVLVQPKGRPSEGGWSGWTWEKEVWVDEHQVLGKEKGSADKPETHLLGMDHLSSAATMTSAESVFPEPTVSLPSDIAPAGDGDDGWGFDEDDQPPAVKTSVVSSVESSAFSTVEVTSPVAEEEDDDGWGFGETTPPPAPAAVLAPSTEENDDEEDAWGFNSDTERSHQESSVPSFTKKTSTAVPRQAKRLERVQAKFSGSNLGEIGRSLSAGSTTSSAHRRVSFGSGSGSTADVSEGAEQDLVSRPRGRGGMKLGRKVSGTVIGSNSRQPSVSSSAMDVSDQADFSEPSPAPMRNEISMDGQESAHPEGPRLIKERYVVSERMKELVRFVEKLVRMAEELSSVETKSLSISSSSSETLMRSISDVLSLYRAIIPVAHTSLIESSPGLGMQAVNDTEYLASMIEHLPLGRGEAGKDDLVKVLRMSGQRWLDVIIDRQRTALNTILDGAGRFTDISLENRATQSDRAISLIIDRMTELSTVWKPLVPLDRAFVVLGILLNEVLDRILREIIGLDDITTKESERLNALCKSLHPLESIFCSYSDEGTGGSPSAVVSYVPKWLKFCYLSEILEASLADITYLFETGGLVDFEKAELVSLLRALFSDTSLRAKTIDLVLGDLAGK